MAQPIDLIAGLGNPDPEYLATRHNAGFWFVDALAARCGAAFSADRKFEGDIAEVEISGRRIRLLKPMTYMNHSGRSLAKAVNYYKTPLDRVLVVYDELDLPPGRVKLKFDGGHAGHNGMRSVIEHVGAALWRLRIGVGHPGPGRKDQVIGHVLRKASAVEEDLVLNGIRDALDSIPILIEKGPEHAKNRLHAPRAAGDGGNKSEESSN
jgi:PTH1 family peptidyl-tRNA hydrolase